jgi:GT2 family glycosyltransferase
MTAPVRRDLDLVVPMYRNAGLVEDCLRSLLDHLHEAAPRRARIVAIDDSPGDAGVDALLREPWLQREDVVVLRNETNLGFVRTANRGLAMALQDGHDAVLVNADTRTFPGAIAALLEAADADPRIGFATPRSNAAAFCSLPARSARDVGDVAPDVAYRRWRTLSASMPAWHPAPTGVGFFLFVAHGVLAEVGLLSEAFGRGYEEENDLAMRARGRGWRAVVVNRAFVWHADGASFGREDAARAALRADNHRRLVALHPSFPGAMRAYENGVHRRAERTLSGLLAHADGRIAVAVDLSSVRGEPDAPTRRTLAMIEALAARHGERFTVTALQVGDAPLRAGAAGIALREPGAIDPHAVVIRVSPSTDPVHLAWTDTLAPCVVHAVHDVLPPAAPQAAEVAAHVACHADALLFADRRVRDAFVAQHPCAGSTPAIELPSGDDPEDAADALADTIDALVSREGLFSRLCARLAAAEALHAPRRARAAEAAVAVSAGSGARRDLAGVLALDAAAFVEAAYAIVLGRPADPAGLVAHVYALERGLERGVLLRRLGASPEAARRRAAVGLASPPSPFPEESSAMSLPVDHALRPVVTPTPGSRSSRTTAPPPAATMRDLLSPSGETFVRTAIVTLLLEAPTDEQVEHGVAVLGTVATKLDYLRRLAATPPGRAAGAPARLAAMMDAAARSAAADLAGLRLSSTRATSGEGRVVSVARPASSVQELLALDGPRFVSSAYATLLLRAVDPSGLAFYTRELERGVSKATILASLRDSAEGRTANASLRGLDELIERTDPAAAGPTPATEPATATSTAPPVAPAPRAPDAPRTVDALLALDGRAFVEAAYAALLHRPADPDGVRTYLEELERGEPKAAVLARLANSPEASGRPTRVEGLDALIRGAGAARVDAAALKRLLALDGEAFVREAYGCLLRRAPDEAGTAQYLAELRAGVAKAQLVRALATSGEARSKGVVVEGLDALPTPRRSIWRSLLGRLAA